MLNVFITLYMLICRVQNDAVCLSVDCKTPLVYARRYYITIKYKSLALGNPD